MLDWHCGACELQQLMNTIRSHVTEPRTMTGKVLGAPYQPLSWSALSCLCCGKTPESELPGPHWIKIETRYDGICGSEWTLIYLQSSPLLTPLGSECFTLGHEIEGTT